MGRINKSGINWSNKDEVNKYFRNYNKMRNYTKKYYENNRNEILAKRAEQEFCDVCNLSFRNDNKKYHFNSLTHLMNIELSWKESSQRNFDYTFSKSIMNDKFVDTIVEEKVILI